MLKNNLLNYKITGNKHIFILLIGMLVLGFSIQCNLFSQPFIFVEMESESKESECQRFNEGEQFEFICLEDKTTGSPLLGFLAVSRYNNFPATMECSCSRIFLHEISNHSPPQFV